MLEQEKKPRREPIPLFSYSNLYLPGTFIPKSETEINEDNYGILSYVGEYMKNPIYIFKPKSSDQKIIHFENRLIHQPNFSYTNVNYDPINLINRINSLSKRIINFSEFVKHVTPGHILSQETLQKYWSMISTTIDQSEKKLVIPTCFLEVVVETTNGKDEYIEVPIDAIGITHSGQVFVIEVATRSSGEEKTQRKRKYKQVKKNGQAFRKQFPYLSIVFDACLFYEECENGDLYLSLRYPQVEKVEE